MSVEVSAPELETSGPVELDQLLFDLHGLSENNDALLETGDDSSTRGDNSEPSVLSSLIPQNINNSSTLEGVRDDTEEQESQDSVNLQQSIGISLPDVVSDGLIKSGAAQSILSSDNQGNAAETADSQTESDRGKIYEQSAESTELPELEENKISLEESVRSLKDVLIESGPVPENTRPVDLVETAKSAAGETEDSESEFEEEYAEQEVIQKSDSESDEFEVPDRPNQSTQNKTVSFKITDQETVPKVTADKNESLTPSDIQTPSTLPSVHITQPSPADGATSAGSSVQSNIPASLRSPQVATQLALIPSASSGLPTISSSQVTGSSQNQPDIVNIPSQTEHKLERGPKVQTSDDWENVTTIQAEFAENKEKSSGTSPAQAHASPLLAVNDAVCHFRESDFSAIKPKVRTSIDRHGFSALAHFFFGPPKLHRDQERDRELVFLIAGSLLNNEDSVHVQMLQGIYRILTGSRFDCQRFGSHWEEIGFQGRDPSTDIRGVGMLGLLQLLYFLRNPKTAQLARDVYKLSLHPTQNFPFCVMGMNMSRICLQSLREDLLNKECNKRSMVIEVVNEFYVGAYLHLYKIWRQGKTITDSGHIIKEVETFAKKNSKSVFKNLEDYLKQKSNNTADITVEEGQEFLSVCKAEPDE